MTMSNIESILEQLNCTFKTDGQQKQDLNLNVYLTPTSFYLIEPSKVTNIFEQVKSKFNKAFDVDISLRFSIIPTNVPNLLTIMDEKLRKSYQEEPENSFMNTLLAQTTLLTYLYQNTLAQKLIDYKLFFESQSTIQKGLHCILHEIEDYGFSKAHGMSIQGRQYSLVSILRKETTLVKHILHEVSHCLGARHSYFPFSIMYPIANSILGSSLYWDPISKLSIRKGIHKLMDNK